MSHSENNPDWTPAVVDNKLAGPLPETVDLSGESFPDMNSSSGFSLYISEDPVVKRLILPCGAMGVDFLCIDNLSSLEEVHLVGDPLSFRRSHQWIVIDNTPSLKKLILRGNVCSLKIENATNLSEIDLSGCPDLDFFEIKEISHSVTINVSGCVKLRNIVGLDREHSSCDEVLRQIEYNQRKSRHDGVLYEGMTFTDIDGVLELINEGCKAMSRKGLLFFEDDNSTMGRFYLAAYDPHFRPYAFRILEPLESVYTGGTGEIYSYVFVQRYVAAEDFSLEDDEGAGNSTPEACLSYMLHWTRMGLMHLPGIKESSDEELLGRLRSAIANTPLNSIPDFSFSLSSVIEGIDAELLSGLLNDIGAVDFLESTNGYIYIYPSSGIPEGEMELARGAALCADVEMAVHQLTAMRDWFKLNAIRRQDMQKFV